MMKVSTKSISCRLADGKLDVMDFARGASILGIVLMHLVQLYMDATPGAVTKFVSLLGSGVHVFFLCSGLGLYLNHLRHPLSFGQFMKRRMLKIYVPYVLVVVCTFFLPWIDRREDRLAALASHVFLYKMLVPAYEESLGEHLWFISTILQLYLAFIPLCRLKEKLKSSRTFFLLTLAVSAAWWVITYVTGLDGQRVFGSFFLQNLWEFALGMCLAEYLAGGKEIRLSKAALAIAAVAGIGLQAGMALASDALRHFNDIPALIGFTSVLLLLYPISSVRKIGRGIAPFSYELYLIHIAVIGTVFYLLHPASLAAQALAGLVSLALCLAAANAYHRLLQKLPQPGVPSAY